MKTILLLSVPTCNCLNQNLICFIDFESSIRQEKCFGKEGYPWYSIQVPEDANCRTQLFSVWCEHGLLQLYVPVKAYLRNRLYCRPTCIYIFFLHLFSFSLSFYFTVSHSCATAEPSIPPELVLDKRTLTVVSNMIHEWKPS